MSRLRSARRPASSTSSRPRTSPTSPTTTSPNRSSASLASRSPATRAKAARSPSAASARSSPASASTGWRGCRTTGGADCQRRRQPQPRSSTSTSSRPSCSTRSPSARRASADVEEGSLGATVDLHDRAAVRLSRRLHRRRLGAGRLQRPVRSNRPARRRPGLRQVRRRPDRPAALRGLQRARHPRGGPVARSAGSAAPTMAASRPPRPCRPARRQGFAFFHPRIPRYDSYRYKTERLGLTGSLQFQADRQHPADVRRALCATSSRTARSNISRRSRSAARGTGKPQTVILPGRAWSMRPTAWSSGTFNNVDVRVESRFDELETKFKQFTGVAAPGFRRRARARPARRLFELGFRQPDPDHGRARCAQRPGLLATTSRNGRNPIFNYGNLDVTNPASFTLGEIRLRPAIRRQHFKVGRAQLRVRMSATR